MKCLQMNNKKLISFTDEELRELQMKELDGLLYFKDFCDKHGLRFFLCGGCCIGALRHKGFIPWDDDVDVFMPRDDYEKLYKLWKTKSVNKRFLCLRTDDEIFTGNIFTTIVDTSGTCVKENQAHLPIPHGIAMDVFPIDGCPTGFKRKMQKFWALIYSLYLAQVVPVNHGKAISFIGKMLLGIVRGKNARKKIWQFCEKKMSKYKIEDCERITELCAGPKYMKNEYPRELFEDAVLKDFEGYKMPIPIGYDEYLKIAFGDYMKMPPKEKQIPHHEIVYYNIDENCYDYMQYKTSRAYRTHTLHAIKNESIGELINEK